MDWLGPVPAMRHERHFEGRVVRCFAERPGNVNAMLVEALARNPDGEALVAGQRRLDYRALDELAGRIAGGLGRLGIGPGDRVALLLGNGIEFVAAFFAILRLGAIAVPLNIREEPPELAYVLAHSGAAALISDTALASKVPVAAMTPELRHRIIVGGEAPGAMPFASLIEAVPLPPCDPAEETVAAILYTSGTTGRPKGAMLTHLGIVHAAMIYQACMGLGSGERSIAAVPLSHVTGLAAGIASMVRVAGTLIVMPEFKADALIALAAAERMTHTVMVPAMYNLCLLAPAFATADLSAWRIGGYGGAPMPAVAIERLAERLPGLRLMNVYGSTETSGPVVLMPPAFSLERRTALGQAVPVAEILIMDDAGRALGAGESGEIWLRAANVAPGYWMNPQATAESFVAGFWRSGDIGSMSADGFLTINDRAKDMINRGGFKIYSGEVEGVLAAHPDVIEAAIVGNPCPVLGERVHAFVVAQRPDLDVAGLRAHCRGQLADYKIPESVTILETALPRNAAGKVLKRELRQRLE